MAPGAAGTNHPAVLLHADLYREAGAVRPYMGIGGLACAARSTWHREEMGPWWSLARALPDSRFHLFGVKSLVFRQREALPAAVASADTGAWGGCFAKGRTPWKEAQQRGLSQDQYEVWEALPAYQRAIDGYLAQPKQLVML